MKINSNLEIKRTFNVNGIEYSSKEEAKMALAMEILNQHVPGGIDEVIKHADDIVSALKVITRTR